MSDENEARASIAMSLRAARAYMAGLVRRPPPTVDANDARTAGPSAKGDAEALEWLKHRHNAPCEATDCDSAYCYIADRLSELLAALASRDKEIARLEGVNTAQRVEIQRLAERAKHAR